MRYCHVCASELAPGDAFCAECGTAVAAQPPQQPTVQEPTVQEPTVQEPTVQQPTVQEPPIQEPAVQQPPVSQPDEPKQPKEKKKKKNPALKIIAAVLAFVILAVGGLFIADYVMYKNEIEANEYITDFPVLKTETDFTVYDEEIFPSTNYRIKVERVLYGGILKSDAFKQTEIIIDDVSTEPVYHINFEEEGKYIITLEDNTDKSSNVIVEATVDDSDESAVNSVALGTKPADKPAEETTTEAPDSDVSDGNFIKATEEDITNMSNFVIETGYMELPNFDYTNTTTTYIIDNLILDPFLNIYELFFDSERTIYSDEESDPSSKFNSYFKIPEENVIWICENIFNANCDSYGYFKHSESTASTRHYLYDGYFYVNAELGYGTITDSSIVSCKIVNNKYEFIIRHYKYLFDEADSTQTISFKKITAEIKETDGRRYWSIYSIENAENNIPEENTPVTPAQPYERDAAVYTSYLTGGELDRITEYMSRDYVEIESCMADFNGDGTYELLISARNTESLGVRGYESNYCLYTIINGSVTKLDEAYYGGGSGGGDNLMVKYDSSLNKYIVMKSSLIRDGAWANDYDCYAYDIVNDQLETYIHTTSSFRSTGNSTYGPIAEEIKTEADICYADENGVTYYNINGSYVTEEEYDQTQARFTDPTDSNYQMKKGTFSNPLGL